MAEESAHCGGRAARVEGRFAACLIEPRALLRALQLLLLALAALPLRLPLALLVLEPPLVVLPAVGRLLRLLRRGALPLDQEVHEVAAHELGVQPSQRQHRQLLPQQLVPPRLLRLDLLELLQHESCRRSLQEAVASTLPHRRPPRAIPDPHVLVLDRLRSSEGQIPCPEPPRLPLHLEPAADVPVAQLVATPHSHKGLPVLDVRAQAQLDVDRAVDPPGVLNEERPL
mmetsp:Transcript_42311/g.135432  ORF Transcript_42311/g.135432 Transcript_42311/m.135432 type:complete len:228 (+) Transcript_42311:3050-3733(+)